MNPDLSSLTTTHLLRNHDHESSKCCAAHTGDSEKLNEAREVSAFTGEVLLAFHLLNVSVTKHYFFQSYLGVYIV